MFFTAGFAHSLTSYAATGWAPSPPRWRHRADLPLCRFISALEAPSASRLCGKNRVAAGPVQRWPLTAPCVTLVFGPRGNQDVTLRPRFDGRVQDTDRAIEPETIYR